MIKQHPPDEQTPLEQQQHRRKALRGGTNTKRPLPARLTLAASLGTLLAMLVWGVLPHQPQAQVSDLDGRLGTTAEAPLTHSGLDRYPTSGNDMNIVMINSESPPTPPVPVIPQPTPVVPQPVVHLDQVPNLVGDDLAIAEQLLAQSGLAVGLVIYQSSDQPAGTVLQTSPAPNTVVLLGSTVNLVVAE